MVFEIFIAILFFLLLSIGIGSLTCLTVSLWRGFREMGRCHNTNSLGTDLSYSELHGDSKSRHP